MQNDASISPHSKAGVEKPRRARGVLKVLSLFLLLSIALGPWYQTKRDNGFFLTTLPEPEPRIRFPKPEIVRGIYLTAWSAGSERKMKQVLSLLEQTELNALVIDVRDRGFVFWETGIALADESGATTKAVPRPDELMNKLEERGIYPIARISCFQDVWVPKIRSDLAVQKKDGTPWKDRAGNTWLDPYNQRNWEYIGRVVDFAMDIGFAEVQLDYVRFPSEGNLSDVVYPAQEEYPDPDASKTDVIAAFARFILERVREKDRILSADIFGIVSSSESDQGIGQSLEKVAEPFDLICPMVYPSHYARGEYGIDNPEKSPYSVVSKSIADFIERLPDKPIRPWLQDFSLRVKYGKDEVQSQIKAIKELDCEEYLLWNPRNLYTKEAVVDTSGLVEREEDDETKTADTP